MRNLALCLLIAACLLSLAADASLAAEPRTASGKVVDAAGNPVGHAAVLVYSARVREGLDLFCPTCYVDCGKRTLTDAAGAYAISGLSPDLVFKLLIVHEGYQATFADNVDPAKGPAEAVVLKQRTAPANPAQVVRGRVVDVHGKPVADALVEQQGVHFPDGGMMFGPRGWVDLISVTNENGEFEIAYEKPVEAMTLQVSPRAMAARLVTEPVGADRKTIVVTQGATVRGRLLQNGKPVSHVEVGLSTHSHGAGQVLPDMAIGTHEDGKFAITNVPPGRVWYLYGKMDSLAPQGLAADIVECATKDDGQNVNVGDIEVRPAYSLRGNISLSDGNPLPRGTRISLFADRVPDRQTLILPPDGHFEFKGLARGVYDLSPSLKDYQHQDIRSSELLIEGDVSDHNVVLEPETKARR